MVAGPSQTNLGFVFQAAKRARVNDPRAIALKLRSISMALFGILSPARFARFRRERRKRGALCRFHLFARPPADLRAHSLYVDPDRSNFSSSARCARRASNR